MANSRTDTPSDYQSARSRSASAQSGQSEANGACLSPLTGDRAAIGVSSNIKRQFKDRRVYVNPRTGLPVRPPTSFGLFKHTFRRSMKGRKVSFQEFNKKATEKWNRLSDAEKEEYAQRSKELAEMFKKIEVSCLRKKVRQLQHQVKEYRRSFRQYC